MPYTANKQVRVTFGPVLSRAHTMKAYGGEDE
jgi:hypothetical protein